MWVFFGMVQYLGHINILTLAFLKNMYSYIYPRFSHNTWWALIYAQSIILGHENIEKILFSVSGLIRLNDSHCDLYRHPAGYHVSSRLSVVLPGLKNGKLITVIAKC